MELSILFAGSSILLLILIFVVLARRPFANRESKVVAHRKDDFRRTTPIIGPMMSSSDSMKSGSGALPGRDSGGGVLQGQPSKADVKVLLSFSAEGYTSLGNRIENDDSYFFQENLVGVADGVGGGPGGAAAAVLALSSVREAVDHAGLSLSAALRDGVYEAQRAVLKKAGQDRRFRRMATTIDCVLLDCDDLANPLVQGVHVGDSRAWLVRQNEFVELATVDHVDDYGNLSQGVGMLTDSFRPEFWSRPIALGDRVVLLTDGVWKSLGLTVVEKFLAGCWRLSPGEASRLLVEIAVGAGGEDNATAVVAEVAAAGPKRTTSSL